MIDFMKRGKLPFEIWQYTILGNGPATAMRLQEIDWTLPFKVKYFSWNVIVLANETGDEGTDAGVYRETHIDAKTNDVLKTLEQLTRLPKDLCKLCLLYLIGPQIDLFLDD